MIWRLNKKVMVPWIYMEMHYHCIFVSNETLMVELTPKEHDLVMHNAKQFTKEGNFILWVWLDG